MPTFDLNLRNFLAHANKASASDTLVMRSDGKTSERGMIRSAFTKIEQYRETTRQFIEKFCMLEGNSQYREMANEFFAENLREEEGKPLSARTVKAFLSAVDAKKAQSEARWEKWSAWTREKPEIMDRKIALATQFEREMPLYTESFMANADFQEATQDLLYMLAQVPERNLQDNDLYQYACDVLKNHSLTADQAAKRLNVLLALVNPESAEFELAGPYGDTECRRYVVMHLLASVDHPNVTGGSSMQILDQVLTLAEKREGLETASFAPGQVPPFSDIQKRIDHLAEDCFEKVFDQIVQIFCSIPKVAEKMPIDQASKLIADQLDSLHNDMIKMAVGNTANYIRLSFADMATAQKIIAWTLFNGVCSNSTSRDLFDQNIPELKGVLEGLDKTAMRATNPTLFELDLRARDICNETEFSDCVEFIGKIDYSVGSKKIICSPMDEQVSEERVFSLAKGAITGDLFRHQAITEIDCYNTPKDKREDSFYHVMIQSANGVETISPCDMLAELVETLSTEQHIKPEDVDLGVEKNTLVKEAGERVASSVRAISQNDRQAAIALYLIGQSNDSLRNPINGLCGAFFDKGVYADEDGNLHVFRQTRKGNPTNFYMEFVVTPDGKVKMDQDSMKLTNDPNDPVKSSVLEPAFQAMEARKTQSFDRATRWAELVTADPSIAERKKAVEERLLKDMVLYTKEAVSESPAFWEVTQELAYLLANENLDTLEWNNLYQFMQSILQNETLTTEQATKRLNLLLAFTDSSNHSPEISVSINSTDDNRELALFRLLAMADDPEVTGETPTELLGSVMRLVEKRDMKMGYVSHELATPESNMAHFDRFVEWIDDRMADSFVEMLRALPDSEIMFAGKTNAEMKAFLLENETDIFFGLTIAQCYAQNKAKLYLNVQDLDLTLNRLSIHAMDFLMQKMEGYGESVDKELPGSLDVFRRLNMGKVREANPALYNLSIKSTDQRIPVSFVDSRCLTGTISFDLDEDSRVKTTCTDPTIPDEIVLNAGKKAFLIDLFRTFEPDMNVVLKASEDERKSMSYSITLEHDGRTSILQPHGYSADFIEQKLFQQGKKWDTLSREERYEIEKESKNVVEDTFGKRVTEGLLAMAKNPRQAAIALVFLGQNQEHNRADFQLLGGTFYNKAIRADEDGNLHVIRQSPENSPVEFFQDMVITPDGRCKMDKDSFVLKPRA